MKSPKKYDESSIKSLDWKQHIRKRPGMYIGKTGNGSSPDDGIYILIKEVLDNSIDEHIMGFGNKIVVKRSENIISIREKRFFRIVDAGMNDLIRPALYGAHHEIFPLKKPKQPELKKKLTIAGPICETGDFFIDRKLCYPISKGDFVAISNAGAYGKVLASTYNSRPLISEYFIES